MRVCTCVCHLQVYVHVGPLIVLNALTKWTQNNREHYNQNSNTRNDDKEAKATSIHICIAPTMVAVLTPPSLHLSGPSEESHFALSVRPLHVGDASWPFGCEQIPPPVKEIIHHKHSVCMATRS